MARGIDHLVLPVRDLDRARAFYGAIGFTTTPVNHHPFGTKNSLVQFDGAFLELLAVADEAAIPRAAPDEFSFAAFNRDFLASREGCSMLVLESRGAAADRAAFEAAGLRAFAPFRFVRDARRPDGTARTVAFSLTFTATPLAPDCGFFTCEQHFPENFWNPDFQSHDNGATGIAELIVAAPDPAALRDFFEAFTGAATVAAGDGDIRLDTGRGMVRLTTVSALRRRFGDAASEAADDVVRFAAVIVKLADLAAQRRRLAAAGIGFDDRGDSVVVPAGSAFGTTLIFARA